MVMMQQFAVRFEYAGPAEAAHAPPAKIRHLDAGRLDGFEQTLIGQHVHADLRAREEHLERVADGRCTELLPMDVSARPPAGTRRVPKGWDLKRPSKSMR